MAGAAHRHGRCGLRELSEDQARGSGMMQRRIGVLRIGNVLMGDDGVGPYAIKLLEARYEFPEHVVLHDLGTPGLGITSAFSDYDAMILIDSVSAKKNRAICSSIARTNWCKCH